MRQFILQMAGESGTGKSTLARAIGKETRAVVLDKDRIKAPVMQNGIEDPLAGGTAYDVFWKLSDDLLEQGFSLVLDSAAFCERVVATGRRLAAKHAAVYYLLECVCPDEELHAARLALRSGLVSQPRDIATVVAQRANPARSPLTQTHLAVDTTRPLDVCLEQALRYIRHDAR